MRWNAADKLPELLKALEQARGNAWHSNSELKYIRVNFDMRDGAFEITDRHGYSVTLERVTAWAREYAAAQQDTAEKA